MRRGDRKENRSHKRIYLAFFVLGTVVILGFLGLYISKLSMISSGLYPVEETLVQAGYKKTSDGFEKKQSNVTITIKWNKEKKGICRKVLIFAMVGVAHILDANVIGDGSVLRTAVIFFYISNEGVSLLENASHLGLPIPEKMKEILEQLHDRDNKESEGK